MDFQNSVSFIAALIALGLTAAGGGMTFLPTDHLTKKNTLGRKIRLVFGWASIIGGYSLVIYGAVIFGEHKIVEAATQLVGGQSSKISIQYTPIPEEKSKKTKTECEAVSIWFVDNNPEFNIYPDAMINGQQLHILEMKFHVELFNKLSEERFVSILYDFEKTRLSTAWKIIDPALEILSPEIKKQLPYEFIIPAKNIYHFICTFTSAQKTCTTKTFAITYSY